MTVQMYPMREFHMQGLLNLCVSDRTKGMLLSNDLFVSVLVDSLLLDPEHPRMVASTFESVKAAVQRDAAEALQQLAVYPPGREALLSDPTVAEALSQVADSGWTGEAQECARGALSAMSDRDAVAPVDENHLHVMISCESCMLTLLVCAL